MDINKDALLMGKPINIDNVGLLYQPTIDEIAMIGYENYFKLLLPFIISERDLESESEYEKVDLYDITFNEGSALILALLFKQDIGTDFINGDFYWVIGEDGVLNRDNIEEFKKAIREINCLKEPDNNKIPKNLSPEQKRIHEKMKYHRKRHAEKNIPTFKEMINVVMHTGDSFISYEEVGKFTYYQLINSYQVMMNLNSYKEHKDYNLSMKYDVKESMPHWTETIKQLSKI